ncbi:endonuclease/exonuclease/phosphatase family protein [Haloarchaeobius amylolyticus]|uniref:endonuclease/exonuclease/phosphatase family protein n=1 Tax=Haloarchaeobius amylolyticus TaxID=1198296 RepID=UPI00226FC838|nr:endonuclease/exonuclease/phosphatase family protein [Haloarchaeobius amylolyticus]
MTDLRVASFNCRYDTEYDGPDAWPNRRERVVDLLGDIDADILGVQEATPHQFAYLREHLPGYDWFGVGRQGADEGEHVPVAYRRDLVDPIDTGAFWLSPTPGEVSVGWDAAYPRVATWLDAEVDGQPLRFLATHLDHEGAEARYQSSRLLHERFLTGEVPELVVGDFNATPQSRPVTALTDAGLRPAREAAETVAGPHGTFHRFDGHADDRIDYVFASDEFAVDRFETVVSSAPYPSDHWPVVADLRF